MADTGCKNNTCNGTVMPLKIKTAALRKTILTVLGYGKFEICETCGLLHKEAESQGNRIPLHDEETGEGLFLKKTREGTFLIKESVALKK